MKKAFIVFNLKSLVPPDDGRAIENVKTAPSAAGCNPTINTLIKFKVPLPVDKLFQPRLLCSVHDYIFKGFNQPLLGTFIIPVGDLIDKLAEERDRETRAIQRILDDLDNIIKGQGVETYSIQQQSPTETDDISINIQTQTDIKRARSTIKIKDELKKPLLLDCDKFSEDEDGEERKDLIAMMSSPRMNARKLS